MIQEKTYNLKILKEFDGLPAIFLLEEINTNIKLIVKLFGTISYNSAVDGATSFEKEINTELFVSNVFAILKSPAPKASRISYSRLIRKLNNVKNNLDKANEIIRVLKEMKKENISSKIITFEFVGDADLADVLQYARNQNSRLNPKKSSPKQSIPQKGSSGSSKRKKIQKIIFSDEALNMAGKILLVETFLSLQDRHQGNYRATYEETPEEIRVNKLWAIDMEVVGLFKKHDEYSPRLHILEEILECIMQTKTLCDDLMFIEGVFQAQAAIKKNRENIIQTFVNYFPKADIRPLKKNLAQIIETPVSILIHSFRGRYPREFERGDHYLFSLPNLFPRNDFLKLLKKLIKIEDRLIYTDFKSEDENYSS